MAISVRGVKVEVEKFPNGESRISTLQAALNSLYRQGPYPTTTFVLHWENDADILNLMFVKRFYDKVCKDRTALVIEYMPYSRMDRQTTDIFTLKYLTDLINEMHFDQITVIEPHSDVTLALLNNSRADYPSADWLLTRARQAVHFDIEHDFLFFPDAGAQKRYHSLDHYKSMVGLKSRAANGQISDDYKIVGPGDDYSDADCNNIIIVDDLCSFGGTFLRAAKALDDMYCKFNLYLVVTHLEESVYRGELLDSGLVKGIFATNSLQDKPKHPLVRLFDVSLHHEIAREKETNE